jgi:hypothetical protein
MAIDFPNTPTTGAIFASGGTTWRWDGTKWVATGSSGSASTSNRNLLINPDWAIDQPYEGASTNTSGPATRKYDGWAISIGSSGGTANGRVWLGGGQFAGSGYGGNTSVGLAIATLAAGDYCYWQQIIEGWNWYQTQYGTLNALPVTVSGWFKSSIAGTFSLALRTMGSSPQRAQVQQFTLPANVWTRIVATFQGDTLSGVGGNYAANAGAELDIVLAAGSTYVAPSTAVWNSGTYLAAAGNTNWMATLNNTFQFSNMKVEIGTSDTPFVAPEHGDELRRCQRYWEKSYNEGVAPGTAGQQGMDYTYDGGGSTTTLWRPIRFKVSKRVAPTMTAYSPNSGVAGNFYDYTAAVDRANQFMAQGTNGFVTYGQTITAPLQTGIHWTADARL